MKKLAIVAAITVVLFVILLILGPFYVVNETEYALVVRFGKISKVEATAGLKLKTPFIDNIVKYSKKILAWDGEAQRIPTKENQFIWVDSTARWRIADPVKFYESLTSMTEAYNKLDDVIDSAVRTVITSNFLREAVRNSNIILVSSSKETFETSEEGASEVLQQLTQTDASFDKVDSGRKILAQQMLAIAMQLAPEYGIEIIDVIPRQIRYSDELASSVYDRMIKERSQIAQAFRSFGEGKKAEWLGKLENEQRAILSKAYEEAEKIKGTADAEATRIYAQAYSRDRSFFEFWRAIESYKTTLPNLNKTISTSMDYFNYIYGPQGK